ncbi:DUF3413 domain-containing protein [Marinomonas rhodophyticola]|uniref:DUF3413 domain-containing protein n=2 Tax=Marinomonas TaxID=28253 RepID=A0ABT3KFM7_9GAMM|nr:DUF3413 domain-containing protein [Marinomonas sp. KJ51-3]MCW4629330.1 DUF3413 domain-containing protein [Marinomonas sp. KJ51-3]
MATSSKRSVFSCFIIINIFFSVLISIRYFSFLPEFPTDVLGASFIFTSLIGQMALLGGILGFFLSSSFFYLERFFIL